MRVRWMASFSWMRVRAGFHLGMRGGVEVEEVAPAVLAAGEKATWSWRTRCARARRDASFATPVQVKMAAVGTLPSAPVPRGMEDETMDEAFAQVDERTYVGAWCADGD